MKLSTFANRLAQVVLGTAALGVYIAANAEITWPSTPLGATTNATPMTMLVAGKDHRLFYEAYNDASDIDGKDGLDIRFNPKITYLGLFQSNLCYKHNDKGDNSGLFTPADLAGTENKCTGKAGRWSGNWLNYVTTSRIDALRVVLYGGYREVDTEASTILRRAYIPQDAHSWAKQYSSDDGYSISDYTPLAQPKNKNSRHFFGSVTMNATTNCATLNTCSNRPPLLSVVQNSSKFVWEWASTERPVLADNTHGGTRKDYTVRVEVCTKDYYAGCKQYPKGNRKPIGLLHEYGENDAMKFGLITGSYDKNQSGGRLRKNITSFKNEINYTTDGTFKAKVGTESTWSQSPIYMTFNNLRIRQYNDGRTDGTYAKWGPWFAGRAGSGSFPDWGNPIGEMMYEAVRYFSGKTTATSAYEGTATSADAAVGLPVDTTWTNPYAADQYCARGNMLVISDTNVSYDSDELPGVYSGFGSFTGDLSGLNVSTEAGEITTLESNLTGLRFIGQSGATVDYSPSAKTVTDLGSVRGLAPEEPSKEGSYYSASVAYFAKKTDLQSNLTARQSLDTFVVALASPLPRIEVKMSGGGTISLLPFAKTVDFKNENHINRSKGSYQPTNQIVDFYVEEFTDEPGSEYKAVFQINFEDVEQGADHDMDAIVKYTIETTGGRSELKVSVQPTYTPTPIGQNWKQRMGYVISGVAETATAGNGIFLEVQNEQDDNRGYYLNTPKGRKPNYCDQATMPSDCLTLPYTGQSNNTAVRIFQPSSSPAATLLNDPLWFAAKYGGFIDRNENNKPDLTSEWDADSNGVPDTYMLVQNPTTLRASLKRTFDNILERAGSGASSIAANSTGLSTETFVYQGLFNSDKWSGDLVAYQAAENGVAALPTWKASEKIPAASDRNIFYGSRSSTGVLSGKGFTWGNLTDEEEAMLDNSEDILNYLRGVRTKETLSGGTLRDRDSKTVLGDISHSSPLYVKDSETVFVGANDGMLHAFDAMNGNERFAYIPSGVFSNLKYITQPAFNQSHKFYVDGDMVASTKAQTGGKNYLVATLGRGGKGLFGLDVTDPDNFNGGSSGNWGWEYFPSEVEDPNLGHMLGRPVIAGNRVIVGNGYNSVNETAVLYVFDIATGAVIHKIDTGVGGDNGLATPGLESSSSHIAYAGDLKGNVWKFDINAGTFSRLFTAIDEDNNPQPITAPIHVSREDSTSRLWVHFGTGSDFRTSDPTNTAKQSWYGLVDAGSIIARSDLFKGAGFDQTQPDTLAGRAVRVFKKVEVEELSASEVLQLTKGWVIDLPEAGERMVTSSKVYTPTAHKVPEPVLVASSVIPVDDPCQPGGRGYINAVNPYTGGRLEKAFFDVNNDGKIDAADAFLVDGETVGPGSIDLGIGKPGEPVLIGNRLVVGGSEGKVRDILINTTTPAAKTGGRISWREIVR